MDSLKELEEMGITPKDKAPLYVVKMFVYNTELMLFNVLSDWNFKIHELSIDKYIEIKKEIRKKEQRAKEYEQLK